MPKKFYSCACFLTNNIFIERYKLHVKFINESQFIHDYTKYLNSKGCEDVGSVISEVKEEIERRKMLGDESLIRRRVIERNYAPKHPEIYRLKSTFLHPEFVRLADLCRGKTDTSTLMRYVKAEKANGVYTFPVFTSWFCEKLLEELDHFNSRSDLPKGRPNTMNKYGLNLSELLNFDVDFIEELRVNYLEPIGRQLFNEWIEDGLDSHKSFTVEYEMKKDVELCYHFDNSEVTLNVCLGRTFDGGSLSFGELRTRTEDTGPRHEVVNRVGYGIFHRGQQSHLARPITRGKRTNLIVWMRSSSIRNRLCPLCDSKPSLVRFEGSNDGFADDVR